ncbi:hypothetical protein [Pseudomonas hunanensis]|uniref:hypothetical protein n=1 Tax=Pseudomonas hunanensis TaxID=1247546 RepID=UPI0030DDDE59
MKNQYINTARTVEIGNPSWQLAQNSGLTDFRVAAIDFIYPPHAGVLVKVHAALPALPAGVRSQLVVEAASGRTLKLPPDAFLDRAAFIITQADTAHECRAASTARVRDTEVILK